MDNNFATVTQHEFEGFWYIEYQGQFFKGCKRCGGTGHYSYDGMSSICYACNNILSARLGDLLETQAAADKWCHERAIRRAQRERKAEAQRLAKLAKRDAAWDALEAAHPAVWALLTSVLNVRDWNKADGDIYPSNTERNSFVLKMAEQLWFLDEFSYSEKMIEALEKIAAKRAEESVEAAAHPAPAGRVVVTGEITSVKYQENDFGGAYKILVKDDAGYKVWCSIPKAQADQAYDRWLEQIEVDGHSVYDYGSGVYLMGTTDGKYGIKGQRITFTATLQPSADDVAFAFGSRPSKGQWL